MTFSSLHTGSPIDFLSLTLLLLFISLTTAQNDEIECLVPARVGDGAPPIYKTGETVQFQWKSTFPRFDLTITQVNSESGAMTNEQKFNNEPNTTASLYWVAHNFAGLGPKDPMYLWITAGTVSACDTCHCRSTNFTVLDETAAGPTTDSSSATFSATPTGSQDTAGNGAEASHLLLALGFGLAWASRSSLPSRH